MARKGHWRNSLGAAGGGVWWLAAAVVDEEGGGGGGLRNEVGMRALDLEVVNVDVGRVPFAARAGGVAFQVRAGDV